MNGIIEKYGAGPLMVGATVLLSVVVLGALILTKGDGPSASEEDYLEIAREVGLDETQFLEDFRSNETKATVEAQEAEILAIIGSASTPTLLINGERVSPTTNFSEFSGIIQSVIDTVEESESQELPVLIEVYEDFNCPSCARFFPITYQAIAEFGDQIEVQHKNLPFLKPTSESYAIASEAAKNQGKYYEFARKIYEKVHGEDFSVLDELDLNLDTLD